MSLLSAARRRYLPLQGLMAARDYRRVLAAPPMRVGETRLLDEPVRYSDNHGLLHSVREIFQDEVYRFEAKTDAPHIVDAGANIGLSVRYFKRLYPRATVVAYEPDPAIFALLRENVGGLAGVELHQAAAWIEDTTLTFYSEGSLAGSTETDFLGKAQKSEVRAERLRDRLRERRCDFLKIDIEGAENEVLFDIAPELDGVDHLFFEYHSTPGKPQRLAELLALVADKGFRYIINGAHAPRLPFVERIERGFDLQLNVSCFRPGT